jgi:hypothetical protein
MPEVIRRFYVPDWALDAMLDCPNCLSRIRYLKSEELSYSTVYVTNTVYADCPVCESRLRILNRSPLSPHVYVEKKGRDIIRDRQEGEVNGGFKLA